MTLEAITVITLALIGASIGSFLNVCIYRLPRRESLMWPASHCTSCGRTLAWYENVPIVGWLALRGRCRTCGERISIVYPIVELVTAIVFVSGYLIYGWTPLLAARLLFACAMIVLFVIDLQHRILPNVITLPGIVIGFVCSLFLEPGVMSSLIGIAIGGGIPWAMYELWLLIRHEEGMGFGDVKMLAMIGAFLGWQLVLFTLMVASLLGSVVGGVMILSKKGSLKYALPFGTFLAVAALMAAVVGDRFVAWYAGFYQQP
jgi:leader peptidase (prepilin peptidase)/N-methyltransferase